VALQLDTLWDECSTDAEIQDALMDLPKDLDETYSRCLTKIKAKRNDFSLKILRWVCVAIKPFTVDQLREALAINEETGRIERERMPTRRDALKCCYNLIMRDDQDRILLAHHSVRQFLSSTRADIELVSTTSSECCSTELELGELCVAHLTSSEYSLALQASGDSKVSRVNLNATAAEALRGNVPSFLRFALPKPRSTRIVVPNLAKAPAPVLQPPTFFFFAKEQWAPLTRSILNGASPKWEKFCTLAIEPDPYWQWHPWPPQGRSLDSHYSGLLGWAIDNCHMPLFSLLFDSRICKPRPGIFSAPFHHHGGLLPLHLAARTLGSDDIVRKLLSIHAHDDPDSSRKLALHHAAETGNVTAIPILLGDGLNAQDKEGQTALHLAAGNGHEETVLQLLSLRADPWICDAKGQIALIKAAEAGHESVVLALLLQDTNSSRLTIYSSDKIGRTALYAAAENLHTGTVRMLLRLGASPDVEDSGGVPMMCKVIRSASLHVSCTEGWSKP
jgi:hypothetical protein